MASEKFTPYQRLQSLIRLERKDVVLIVGYGIAIASLWLVIPVAVSSLVNTVAFGVLLQPVVVLALIVFLALGFVSFLQLMQTILAEMLQRRIFARSALSAATRIPRTEITTISRYHGPELLNRFLETMALQKGVVYLVLDALPSILSVITGLIIVAVYHPLFLLFDLLVIIVGGLIIGYYMAKPAARTKILESDAKFKTAAWLQEIARHSVTFSRQDGYQFALKKTENIVSEYINARELHFKYTFRQVIGFLALKTFSSSLVLGIGGYLVIQQQLTLGQLVAAQIIVFMVIESFSRFGGYFEALYDVFAALDKLGKISDVPLSRSGAGIIPEHSGPAEIRLNNIKITDEHGFEEISDLSLHIRPGEKIGITGNRVLGISFLIDTIAGFRDPAEGYTDINGYHVRDLADEYLMSRIRLLRHNEIFHGTYIENIALGRPIEEGQIRFLLEELGLSGRLIESYGTGLTAEVQTYGPRLNQTATKQILLARAMVNKPSLLMLDEILDGMEPGALTAAMKLLLHKKAPWTLLLVSQHQSILNQCDRVLHLDSKNHKIKINRRRGRNASGT